MSSEQTSDRWDISGRPHTRTKLEILRKCFGMWLTIWNAPRQRRWASNEWYVVDLFAGRGTYSDKERIVSGSPLVFLETIDGKKDKLIQNSIKIKIILIEQNRTSFKCLESNINEFIENVPRIKDIVEVITFNDDCNEVTEEVINQIRNTTICPLFVLVDPWGIKIKKKTTMEEIVRLNNRKDIMFNYILEGVRRTSGILEKAYHSDEELSAKEKATLVTLREFIGDDVNILDTNGKKALDIAVLEGYVDTLFYSHDLRVVAYDMEYADRNDILYYLLFATKQQRIINIVKDIYARQKKESEGFLPFGGDFYRKTLIDFTLRMQELKRK